MIESLIGFDTLMLLIVAAILYDKNEKLSSLCVLTSIGFWVANTLEYFVK